VTVLAALSPRAIGVGATHEETRIVLASHIQRAIEVLLASKRAHPAATVAALAAEAVEAVQISATDASDAASASGRIETTARVPIRVVVIVTTASCTERAHYDYNPSLDRSASNP